MFSFLGTKCAWQFLKKFLSPSRPDSHPVEIMAWSLLASLLVHCLFYILLVPESAKTRSKSTSCWPPFAVNITISFCYNWLLLSCTFHCCRLPWPWDAHLLQVEDNTEKLRQLSLLETQVAHFLPVCAPSRSPSLLSILRPFLRSIPQLLDPQSCSKVVRLTVTSVSELRDRLETHFQCPLIDFNTVTLRINGSTVDQVFRLSFINFEQKHVAQHYFKSSLCFQHFFDPNQGSTGFKIDNFVTFKSFSLKVNAGLFDKSFIDFAYRLIE